uniref:Protein kinase C-binding protein NELL2 n=2 Tax=Lygus hesperus TaxID=30085 RepID=A0A146LP18_LYGHE
MRAPPLLALLTVCLILLHKTSVGREDVSGGLDLLGVLQLHNSSHPGVSITPGIHSLTPAFYLQGSYRDLKIPEVGYKQAVTLLQDSTEFTMCTSIRQELANSGTLISFSQGVNRYLELQSSGRKDEVRLHYTSRTDNAVHVETFPYRLADRSWHKLALSVSGSQVQLLVDCHPVYRRVLMRPLDTNFSLPQLSLWVGQRNNRHSLFKGALQDVRIIRGAHGYLSQCPQLDTSCPTCGEFMSLQAKLADLSNELGQVTKRLKEAESRISAVEVCDCIKSCNVNDTIRADGSSWQVDCDICSCVHGVVECRPVQCPKVNCKKPVLHPGQCCPTCLKQCYLRGTLYEHSEVVSLKQCVQCECHDGSMHCTRIDPETMCPPLDCPANEQFSVPDECCKFCPGVDYCIQGHQCHENATCLNLDIRYACHCNSGFKGDGYNCLDIDECLMEGGVEGHHCHSNSRCVNTRGGYECECLPGHRRVDRFNCAEVDECMGGLHECDKHAKCVNTQGSYHCVCSDGYTGDGYNCAPVCEAPCENGGTCIDSGVCSCRPGYQGPSCSEDLNECTSGLHSCDNSSICINMPGWYYCTCGQGYIPSLPHLQHQQLCQDIDECATNNHTCHESAVCVNLEGSYKCTCPPTNDNTTECKLSCMLNGKEVEDGEMAPSSDCTSCVCTEGLLTCTPRSCDCSTAPPPRCCPQCYPATYCTHQELSHVKFASGDKWIYQCQTCECLMGEIDCWEVECPPVWCESAILSTSDCCPRCPSEPPCNMSSNGCRAGPGMPGRYFQPRPWSDINTCSSCNCKVPFCDLLVSNSAFCVHRRATSVAALIQRAKALFGPTPSILRLQTWAEYLTHLLLLFAIATVVRITD